MCNEKNVHHAIHRGAADLFQLIIYFGISAVILAAVVSYASGLWSKSNEQSEYQNATTLLANTRAMLKNEGVYDFTSAAQMTGTLVQFGGVPKSMGIIGEQKSGSVKVKNSWGGEVTVTPASSGGTDNAGFTLTYEKVPYQSCMALATQISQAPNVVTTKVNGTENNGAVKSSAVGAQCQADNGGNGTNSGAFTTNS